MLRLGALIHSQDRGGGGHVNQKSTLRRIHVHRSRSCNCYGVKEDFPRCPPPLLPTPRISAPNRDGSLDMYYSEWTEGAHKKVQSTLVGGHSMTGTVAFQTGQLLSALFILRFPLPPSKGELDPPTSTGGVVSTRFELPSVATVTALSW